MNKKGLAQIPLMIGLLIMAVVVPIATRLVQQNQDNRNLAAGCSQSGIGQCGANGGCSTGYRCIYGANTFHCSYDPACGGFTPTSTPRPVATNTPRPVATSTPRPPTPTTGPCNANTAGLCGIAGGCPIGQKCQGPIYTCISNSSCGGFIPTIMPTLYPTPNTCFAASGRPENCFCENDYQCITGYCFTGTPRTCEIRPTATPTPRPNGQSCVTHNQCQSGNCNFSVCKAKNPGGEWCSADAGCTSGNCLETLAMCEPLPDGKRCDTDGQCVSGNCIMITGNSYKICNSTRPNGQACITHNQCQSANCQSGVCKAKVAGGQACSQNTNCTSGNCLETLGMCEPLPDGKRCETDGQCVSGNCIMITGNLTKICDSPRANGQSCVTHNQCQSGNCKNGVCTSSLTPTPSCLANGRITSSASNCCSGYAAYLGSSLTCTTAPTATPTKKPTSTPTKVPTSIPTVRPTSIPCASTGQACTTRSCCTTADVCTDEGLSYPVCVPRNQIPTYIPIPTIDCAKSGQGCSTRPCCEAYLDVCTDEGLSYPRCVPRNQIPTYIPIPTIGNCAKIGESCSQFKGCCGATDKCVSGKCIASVPTGTNPTGIYPTGGPIPTTGGCSGSKPADKCESKTLFINAQCVNKQWDWDEQVCSVAGIKETCSGKNYCCPSAGGAWTTDMTKCPATTPLCTECPKTFSCYSRSSGNGFGVSVEHRWFAMGIPMQDFTKVADSECGQIVKPTFKGKSQGDANCDGTVDNWDYDLWYKEFFDGNKGATSKKTWNADFTGSSGVCDGKVGIYDYSLWLKYFNQFNIN